MTTALKTAKNTLSIQLTEPVVFLHDAIDATLLGSQLDAKQPAMLRGLLTLTLHKPTKISSIEIELEGTVWTTLLEGEYYTAATEVHNILSASTVLFRACTSDHSLHRRAVSVGPGLHLEHDEHEHHEDSSGHDEESNLRPHWLANNPRRASADHSTWQRDVVSHSEAPPPFDEAVDQSYTPIATDVSRANSHASGSGPSSSNCMIPGSLGRRSSNALGDRHSAQVSFVHSSNVPLDTNRHSVHSISPHMRTATERPSPDLPSERSVSHNHNLGVDRGRAQRKDKETQKGPDRLTLGKRLSEMVERTEDLVSGNRWKEFRKGTYTYPISFAVPSDSPPTLHCDYGSVTYCLKATVHRPGAFTSKLTATREVVLIASPGEDDLEQSDNVILERSWDSQMHFEFIITGRVFPVGGTIPLRVSIMPMSNVKIYRITTVLEEHVEYYTQFSRVARSQSTRRFELLGLKYSEKDTLPLLPLTSDYESSPLHGMVEVDLSEKMNAEDAAGANLAGPGPWTVRSHLQLPTSCEHIHATNKHRKSNIGVSHLLKIMLRVERSDETRLDPKTGKKMLFDIIVRTPVYILSFWCNPEWTTLPRYSSFVTDSNTNIQSCMRNVGQHGSTVSVSDTLSSTASHSDTHDTSHHILNGYDNEQKLSSHAFPNTSADSHGHTPESEGRFHVYSPRTSSHPSTDDYNVDNDARLVHTPSDAVSRYNLNTQFARLVAGQESERGEEPPQYDLC